MQHQSASIGSNAPRGMIADTLLHEVCVHNFARKIENLIISGEDDFLIDHEKGMIYLSLDQQKQEE